MTPEGGLVVLDATGPVLVKLGACGAREWFVDAQGSGPGELGEPSAVAVDSDGSVWVSDRRPPRLHRFDSQGRFVGSQPSAAAALASDLAVENGRAFIGTVRSAASWREKRSVGFVAVDDLDDGAAEPAHELDLLIPERLGRDPFWNAPLITSYLALSPFGEVAVTYDLARVVTWFASSGERLRTIRGCEGAVGNEEFLRKATRERLFYRPLAHDLAFDGAGTLWILTPTADQGWHRVERYGAHGEMLPALLLPGRERGGTYLSALLPSSDPGLF